MTGNLIGAAVVLAGCFVVLAVWGNAALKRRRIEQVRERLNF